jgi:DNA-binding NarL/FixJ family response regulator
MRRRNDTIGLRQRTTPNINITGDFETAEDCIEALEKQPADVILMDLGLPYMTGIEATKIIHNK